MLNEGKERLQLWRSSSARAGADAALMLIMSWHEDIKLEKIQSLWEGGIWNTDPALVQIREEAANFMARFANTANLDIDADVNSDDEDGSASGSDVEDSDDSLATKTRTMTTTASRTEQTGEFLLGYDLLPPAKLSLLLIPLPLMHPWIPIWPNLTNRPPCLTRRRPVKPARPK